MTARTLTDSKISPSRCSRPNPLRTRCFASGRAHAVAGEPLLKAINSGGPVIPPVREFVQPYARFGDRGAPAFPTAQGLGDLATVGECWASAPPSLVARWP